MMRRGDPVLFGEPGSPEQLAEVSRLAVLAVGSVGLLGFVTAAIVMVHGRPPKGYHPLALAALSLAAITTAGLGWHRRTLFSPTAMPYVLVVAALGTAGGAFLSGPVFGPLATMCFLWYGSTITYLPRRVAVGLMVWASLVCGAVLALQDGNPNPLGRWSLTVGTMVAIAVQWNLLVERSWTLTRSEQAARTDAEQARAELEVASEQRTRFLARMSHELRTPLNAIIGFSGVLARRSFGELNAKQGEYVDDVVESGQHLLALVDDLLDLTKVETGAVAVEADRIDLGALLASSLALFKEQAGRHRVALELVPSPELLEIEADARKLKQVMFNLLANAVRFTPEGGSVTVAAVPARGQVHISVTDTGPGIAPEDREAIFEEFRQADRAGGTGGGTGLGLPLARRLVEAHGGRLSVSGPADGGSTFTVELPVRPTSLSRSRDDASPIALRPERRVLGVPDSPEGRAECARVYVATIITIGLSGLLAVVSFHVHPAAVPPHDLDALSAHLTMALVFLPLFKFKPQTLGSPMAILAVNLFVFFLLFTGMGYVGPLFADYTFLVFVAGVGTFLLLTPNQRRNLLVLAVVGDGAILGLRPGYPVPVAHWVMAAGFLVVTVLVFGQFMARIEAQADAERVARAEAERVKTELELASRHKIEFLANMSHELRTPLNVIIGFSEVLDRQAFGPLNEKQAEYVRDVLSSGRHLLALINDILDMAKIDAGRMDLWCLELEVEAVVTAALQLYREAAVQRHIDVTAVVEPGAMIEADEAKLAAAIGHLVSNALKFSPDGGEVALRARRRDGDVEILITDTGPGIDVSDQERIFDAFALGDTQAGQGTGLGLALARRYAELHHGTLDVNSEAGRGATFVLRLPIQQSTHEATAPAEVG